MDNVDLDAYRPAARMVVIGVGGGGSNAVERMIDENLGDVEFYVLNTDKQSLAMSHCENRIILGERVSQGLGAGGDPEVGKAAANDTADKIREIVSGANMVFIAAGMGGGTGTGAAPIVAKVAKEEGAVVVAVVTRPFSFEGKRRINQSIDGLNELKKEVDALIVVSNDRLLMLNGTAEVGNAFAEADRILAQSVRTITNLILCPSIINSDFADVRNVLKDSGVALIGYGTGRGPNKAIDAAVNALTCPLLEANISGARRGICSVTCGTNVTLFEAQDCVSRIVESSGNEMDIKFSVSVNDQLDDTIIVSVIASDFKEEIDFAATATQSVQHTPIRPTINIEPVIKEDQNEKKIEVEEAKGDFIQTSFIPDFLLNKDK